MATNITPETAILISTLPYVVTLDASAVVSNADNDSSCANTPSSKLWWKILRSTTGLYFSTRVTVTGTNYEPVISVWGNEGSGFSQLDVINSCAIIPTDAEWLFIPTRTSISEYYIQVANNSALVPTGTITVNILGIPNKTALPGSILITDDSRFYPALIFDAQTGELLKAVDIVASEIADILPTGEIAAQLSVEDPAKVRIYTNQVAVVDTLEFTDTVLVIRAMPLLWYIAFGDGFGAVLNTVSPAATIGSTWELSTTQRPSQVAISPDETIAYWIPASGTGAFTAIKRHDLTNNVPLSDLLTVTGGTITPGTADMQCLNDGSMLVGFLSTVAPFPSEIRRYDTTGSLINTYPILAASASGSISHYRLDPNGLSVWVWIQVPGSTSELRRIKLSDGTVLVSLIEPLASTSGWSQDADFPFVASNSCPLMITPHSLFSHICEPCEGSIRRVSVYLNGVRQFSSQVSSMSQIILPCAGMIEALKNDVITVKMFQDSGNEISVIPSFQMHRVTYSQHGKESGRNRAETVDPRSGGSSGSGCSGCDPTVTPPPIGMPAWLEALLTTNCYNQTDLDAGDATINANGYTQQRNSAGEGRGRLYVGYPIPDYSQYIDLVRPDCGWGWYPNF